MRESTVALITAIAALISTIYNCLHRKGLLPKRKRREVVLK
jgi:hypothetical protein